MASVANGTRRGRSSLPWTPKNQTMAFAGAGSHYSPSSRSSRRKSPLTILGLGTRKLAGGVEPFRVLRRG
jgi:hypothetical protein